MVSGILSAFTRRKEQRLKGYTDLVRVVADDGEYDPDTAAEILIAANKQPKDLNDDAARLRQRKVDRAAIDGEPKLRSRIAELGEAIEAAKQQYAAEVARLGAELDQQLAGMQSEHDAMRGQVGEPIRARRRLRETCSADLKRREQQLLNQKREECAGHAEMTAEIQKHDYAVRLHQRDPKRHEQPEPNADVEAMRVRLSESKSAAAKIDRELDDLHAEMLKP